MATQITLHDDGTVEVEVETDDRSGKLVFSSFDDTAIAAAVRRRTRWITALVGTTAKGRHL